MTNTATGKQVLLSEPLYWGMRVTRMSLDVQKVRGQWQVVHSEATLYNSNTAPEDPAVTGAVAASHAKVLTYVNSVIGQSLTAMSAATSRYEDTAAMDFINYVQAERSRRRSSAHLGGACRCSRSRRPSTRRPRSRRATSRCATSPVSTSTTTRCSASC